VFNEDLLTQFRKLYFKGQHVDPAPPLYIINKEEEYKVEKVRNHRKQGCGIQLLIHWKRYGNEHDQWISETELPHAKKAIGNYWSRISSQNL